jgi:iron complex outermembrane receptor protein
LSGGVRPTDGNFINQHQFSEELQLAGKALDNRLNFIVGGFYFKENGTDRSRSAALFPLSLSIGYIDGTISNKSIAGYGQFTYSLSDALRVTAGLRYTKDTRSAVLRNSSQNFLSGVFTSSLQAAPSGSFPGGSLLDGDPDGGGPALSSVPGDPFRASFRRSFNYLSYTLGLDWEASKGLFFYAKTSRANRSGGFNTRAVVGGTPPVSFRPERVTDYELGAKLDLLDRRVRLNLAGYYSKIDDIQRNIVGVPLGGSLTAGADNVGSAHIWGGEAELTVVPVENLRLSGSAGLTYPKYDVFINSIDGSDSSSAAFPYTPKQTYSINADYDLPIEGAGTLSFHTDYSYKSSLFSTTIALSAAGRIGLTPAQIAAGNAAIQNTAKIPGYGLLNARIAFTFDKPDLEIALYARNITKKEYITRLLPVENTPLGFTSYTPGDPRTYGVSATIKF